MKNYSKKQIFEALSYWLKQLKKKLNESSTSTGLNDAIKNDPEVVEWRNKVENLYKNISVLDWEDTAIRTFDDFEQDMIAILGTLHDSPIHDYIRSLYGYAAAIKRAEEKLNGGPGTWKLA